MSWAKLDDRYDDNRKIKRAWRRHPRAVGVHAMAITYCSRHRTDGIVDIDWLEERLPVAKERVKVIGVLVDLRLFEEVDEEHWYVHDFLEYNPSRVASEQRAHEKVEAGRRGGQEKARRREITERMRQGVARRLGFEPGDQATTSCSYCEETITVDWSDPKRVRFLDAEGRATPELDHIDPVANNGAHEIENLSIACLSCNRRKGASTALAPASEGPVAPASAATASTSSPVPSRPDPTKEEQNARARSSSSSKQSRAVEKAEAEGFAGWLLDHSVTTGRTAPGADTKAYAALASAFNACRAEGHDLGALKLATRAAHASDFRRANGYDKAESVLRVTKVHDLIEDGRRAGRGVERQADLTAKLVGS